MPHHHERGALGAPSIEGKKCATKIFTTPSIHGSGTQRNSICTCCCRKRRINDGRATASFALLAVSAFRPANSASTASNIATRRIYASPRASGGAGIRGAGIRGAGGAGSRGTCGVVTGVVCA